jgi:hypothetical protein
MHYRAKAEAACDPAAGAVIRRGVAVVAEKKAVFR